jgi:hypothetical protein
MFLAPSATVILIRREYRNARWPIESAISYYDTEESDSDESGDENENDSNEDLTWRETGLKISVSFSVVEAEQ